MVHLKKERPKGLKYVPKAKNIEKLIIYLSKKTNEN